MGVDLESTPWALPCSLHAVSVQHPWSDPLENLCCQINTTRKSPGGQQGVYQQINLSSGRPGDSPGRSKPSASVSRHWPKYQWHEDKLKQEAVALTWGHLPCPGDVNRLKKSLQFLLPEVWVLCSGKEFRLGWRIKWSLTRQAGFKPCDCDV